MKVKKRMILWFLLLGLGVVGALPASLGDSARAEAISSHMPRVYGGRPDSAELLHGEFVHYLTGVASLAGFGLLFLLAALFASPWLFCAKLRPRLHPGNTNRSLRLLVGNSLVVIAGIGCLWFFSSSLHGELTLDQPGHLLYDAETSVDHLQQTIETINTTVVRFPDRTTPVQDVLNLTVDQVNQIATQSQTLQSSLQVGKDIVVPSKNITVYTRPGGRAYVANATWFCSNCATIQNQLINATLALQRYNGAINPTLDSLQVIGANVIRGKDRLRNATGSLSTSLTSTHQSIEDRQSDFNQYGLKWYEDVRQGLFTAIMCLPLASLLLIIVAQTKQQSWLYLTVGFFSWLVLVAFSFAFAVMLPVTTLISDGCVTLNYAELHLAEITDPVIDHSLQICVNTSSTDTVAESAFNLTSEFDVMESDYTSFDNLSNHVLQLDPASIGQQIQQGVLALGTLNIGHFGINDSQIDEYIVAMNHIIAQYSWPPAPTYTRSNLTMVDDSTPHACEEDHVAVLTYKYRALQLMDAEDIVNDFIGVGYGLGRRITSDFYSMRQKVDAAQESLNMIPPLLSQTFDDLRAIVQEIFWCGWLNDDYSRIKTGLCDRIPTDLGFISLTLLITLVASVPMIGQTMRQRPTTHDDESQYDQFGNLTVPQTHPTQLSTIPLSPAELR